jgi:hypothetical protein
MKLKPLLLQLSPVGVVDTFLAADFSLPLSLLASSSLEAALEFPGKLARLKWSNSGGNKLVPE